MNYTERTRLIDGLCGAFLMALLFEIFYSISDAAYTVFLYKISDVTTVIHIVGGIALAIALVILVIAYRKEKKELAIYGVELLVFAVTAGLLPATYISFPFPFNRLNVVFPLAFGVYYIMKGIYIVSKRNTSNAIMLGVTEAIYILILALGILAYREYIFMALSLATVIYLIYAMVKKSKFLLVHALELMVVTFSMLVMNTPSALKFFGGLVAVYYIAKSVFITMNGGTISKKKNKSKRRK